MHIINLTDPATIAKIEQLATPGLVGDAVALDPSTEHIDRLLEHDERDRKVSSPKWADGPEHLIYGSRQHGKTRLALRWLREGERVGEDRVLVMLNDGMADHFRRAEGFQRNDGRIISWRQLQRRGPRAGAVYGIDEAGEMLAAILKLRESPRLMTVCTAAPWQTQEENLRG